MDFSGVGFLAVLLGQRDLTEAAAARGPPRELLLHFADPPLGRLHAGLGVGSLVFGGSAFPGANADRTVDYTGDGIDDLVLTNYSYTYLYADGLSGLEAAPEWTGLGAYDFAHAGDMNGDGYNDMGLVVISTAFRVYPGTSTGISSTLLDLTYPSMGMTTATGDVDGDGLGDVVTGSPRYNGEEGRIAFFYGASGPTCPVDTGGGG